MLLKRINKSHVWVIIVCLLIISVNIFVVTWYAQIKYGKVLNVKNIGISNNEEESILKENKDLRDTIDSLKKELDKQKEETKQAEQKYKSIKEYNASVLNMYELIIKAEFQKQNGNVIAAADSLTPVDKEYLLPNCSELNNRIRSEISKPAATYFYKAGLDSVSDGKYEVAADYLKKSLYFIENEDFKEDCSFLLGKSYYLNGNYDMAEKTIKRFIDDFPESKYNNEATNLLTELNSFITK